MKIEVEQDSVNPAKKISRKSGEMRIINLIFISFLMIVYCGTKSNPEVRKSVLAGTWYSDSPSRLRAEIDQYLKKGQAEAGERPLILIQPHAGYLYSGGVAGSGYALLKNTSPDIIVIIAPAHRGYFRGCSILPVDYYETPLGLARVDRDIVKFLLNDKLFETNSSAHASEHSIEIQIPFLQRVYGNKLENSISIVPVLVGEINRQDASDIALHIVEAVKKKRGPIFIISSDFTHYGSRFGYLPYRGSGNNILKDKIRELDYGAINKILERDFNGFCDYIEKTGATICGRNAIKIALSLPFLNFKSRLISYDTSGNITGDYSNTVSYASILISGELRMASDSGSKSFDLSEKEKGFLLKLARDNIISLVNGGEGIKVKQGDVPENCKYESGVFVTIKKKGNLRGCIGYVIERKPLYEAVLDNAYNAAFRDPRFPPLEKKELKEIKVEISVLTVPQPVASIDEIEVGRDGLIVEQGFNRGLLLPQVPVEWKWDKETFLIHTCRKAGLPDYAWKHGAKISRFQAIVFGEGETN